VGCKELNARCSLGEPIYFFLSNLSIAKKDQWLRTKVPHIRTAGGQIMPVQGHGTITITDCFGKIKDVHQVLYVPNIKISLFSIGKLIDLGYRVLCGSTQCSIYDKD